MVWGVGIGVLLLLGFMFYASYSIASGVYLKALCRLPQTGRSVLLTFDDGPDPVQTAKVLDVLREHQLQALFFVVGERAQQCPDLLRQMVADGHLIGIHTWRHQSSFPMQSAAAIAEDLQRCCDTLQSITGQRPVLFRPPFGVTNPPIAKAVGRLGLKAVGWSIRSYDTVASRSRERVADRIFRRLKPGAILLLHDDRPDSEILLRLLIEGLRERSYTITTPSL
ncbi:MAG: polysaccharide deacetylase family protein [Paludibacteraceae bacterium]|nr:polysaccharide deacetylase family protein [Paludibacteraceae bacterium]